MTRACTPSRVSSWAFLLGLALTTACGARPQHGGARTGIDVLRELAAAHPRDAAVQSELAVRELLGEDGDPQRAEAQIGRALTLAPKDGRLLFLAGLERQAHGQPAQATRRLLEAVEASAGSERPEARRVAEVASHALGELSEVVPGFRKRVEARLAALARGDRGVLGRPAAHGVDLLRLDLALRAGDRAAADRIAKEAGCQTEWRVAGPFGPRDLLGLDESHVPGGPLGERHDLGKGRGEHVTRDVRADGCAVHVGDPSVPKGGTTYAEATFAAKKAGPHVIHLETPNAVELYVDGTRVARLDARRHALPRVTYHEVSLSAGTHRVRAKIATRHPNPVLAVSVAPGQLPKRARDNAPEDAIFVSYLAAAQAFVRGDEQGATARLEPLVADGKASPVVATLLAGAALANALRSPDMRRDEARRLLRDAAARDPEAFYPALQLAKLTAAEGRLVAAIESLRDASGRWPAMVVFPLVLSDLLLQRGWEAEAEQWTSRALERAPGTCPPLHAALSLALGRDRTEEVTSLSKALVACDARSSARFDDLVRQRRWDEAEREAERLHALSGQDDDALRLTRAYRLARGRGDAEAAARAARELTEKMPLSSQAVLMVTDGQLRGGDRPGAVKTLESALETEPGSMAELRWVHRILADNDPLARWRLDGDEVLRAFESSGRSYDAPEVLVLDYTVVRLFEDGSALELTHNIFKVQSEEAVDSRGEYSPPEGARLLTLRTIKADGTHIEPDPIAGKDTLSLPNLSPGDYVEYEYARLSEPPTGFPGGAIGDRFYFRSFELPFDRSELTLVVPEGMKPFIDPRGDAPETETARTDDGLTTYRWRVKGSPPITPEPASVPPREWIPSVSWGIDATWEAFVVGLRDLLADRNVVDPEAVTLARHVAGDGSAAVRAKRLYAWVLRNVEASRDVSSQAAAMLAGRTGDRARVLHYLLGLVGIESELVLARDIGADQTRSELADDTTYDNLLVMLPGKSPRFLAMGERYAPFGYLPPPLRGQDALVLTGKGRRVTLPASRSGEDRHDVTVDVTLSHEHTATVKVRETFHGAPAVTWREELDGVPDAVLEQRFEEAYVSQLVPGAHLVRLEMGARKDESEPLTFAYTFEVGDLGQREGRGWLIPGLFPSNLSAMYAPTASRKRSELVALPQDSHVVVRVEVPAQYRIARMPESAARTGPGGATFSLRASQGEGVVILERSIRIPIMRVTPEDYGKLATYCRAVDDHEAQGTLLAPR